MHDDDLVSAWRELAPHARGRRDAEAEDHLQDAVVAALDERRRTGRAPAAAPAWLRTVARRREVDRIRRAECERRALREAGARAEPEAYDIAGDVVDRHEARWLATRVGELPPATRQVVAALAEGGSQAEVAERLGLTPRAVEAHVRRARIALRRARDRAGAVAGLLLGRRWWRRGSPVAAAGVATAVGLSMIGTGDPHTLRPIPRPPVAVESPDPAVVRRAPADPPRRAVQPAAPLPAAAPAARTAPPRRQAGPAPQEAPDRTPAPPPAEPAGPQVVLVWSNGSEAATAFTTDPGTVYDISVSGVYSYNGRVTGLADCGHTQPEHLPGWHPYEALYVDDAPSPCARMPLNELHTYRWRARGTGAPMRFRVHDFGDRGDNRGHLVVTVTPVTDPAAEPSAPAGLPARR